MEDATNSKAGGTSYGTVDPSQVFYQRITYVFQSFQSKKSSMICTIKYPFLLKHHNHQAAWEKVKFKSAFLFLLHY